MSRSGKRRKEDRKEDDRKQQETYTGVFRSRKRDGFWIEADGDSGEDIFVKRNNSGGAQNGQRVEFAIIGRRFKKGAFEAKVVTIVSDEDAFFTEKLLLPEKHKLPLEYSSAKKWETSIPPLSEMDKERRDCTSVMCVTIDPDDAKDFDDAIALRKMGNNWELFVFIADVSFFVREGTALDKEARRRGCSTYLPWGVIPMLPPFLSEDLCSLKEGLIRPAVACRMILDEKGDVISDEVFKCYIKSRKRLTYSAAQNLIDGKSKSAINGLAAMLISMNAFASLIRLRRFENGSLDFTLPEFKIDFSSEGLPVSVRPYEKHKTNEMVEEFMLLANKFVAKRLVSANRPAIYRIHTPPEGEALDNLRQYAAAINVKAPINGSVREIRKFLDAVVGTPFEKSAQTIVLRSMARARYSAKCEGHFGLSFDFYTHFTSPIRRYPDLLVHRLLFQNSAKRAASIEEMQRVAILASANEERSTKAERDAVSLAACTALRTRLGEEMDGKVSGIIEAGLFVELKDMGVDGMIHVSRLRDGYFVFDAPSMSLYCRETGKRYRVGDRVRVKISEISIPLRRVDLLLLSA